VWQQLYAVSAAARARDGVIIHGVGAHSRLAALPATSGIHDATSIRRIDVIGLGSFEQSCEHTWGSAFKQHDNDTWDDGEAPKCKQSVAGSIGISASPDGWSLPTSGYWNHAGRWADGPDR